MFEVPIDYQCAILVFHAVTPSVSSCPAMLGRLQEARPACEERRADAWLPIGNRTTKGSSEILPYDAMPDPEMSRIRTTNSARSFYLVTEYLPPLFAGWPRSCSLLEIMIL